MTTVAYLAVSPEGRTDRQRMHLRPEALPGLQRLADAVHAEGAALAGQVGHAGPVANGRSNGVRAIVAYRMPSPLTMQMVRTATEADITRVTRDYVEGARLAVRAGLDCLEMQLGHNYLPSSFMSPNLNRLRDRWGGSLQNHARFARQVVPAVRDAVGDEVAVTAKLNMVDGIRSGPRIGESLDIASMLEADRTLDAVQLTSGSSLTNPMFLFRGDVPLRELADAMPPLQRWGIRAVGKKLFRHYPLPVRGGVHAADGTALP